MKKRKKLAIKTQIVPRYWKKLINYYSLKLNYVSDPQLLQFKTEFSRKYFKHNQIFKRAHIFTKPAHLSFSFSHAISELGEKLVVSNSVREYFVVRFHLVHLQIIIWPLLQLRLVWIVSQREVFYVTSVSNNNPDDGHQLWI